MYCLPAAKTIGITNFSHKSYKTTRTKNAGTAKCHSCIFSEGETRKIKCNTDEHCRRQKRWR